MQSKTNNQFQCSLRLICSRRPFSLALRIVSKVRQLEEITIPRTHKQEFPPRAPCRRELSQLVSRGDVEVTKPVCFDIVGEICLLVLYKYTRPCDCCDTECDARQTQPAVRELSAHAAKPVIKIGSRLRSISQRRERFL